MIFCIPKDKVTHCIKEILNEGDGDGNGDRNRAAGVGMGIHSAGRDGDTAFNSDVAE